MAIAVAAGDHRAGDIGPRIRTLAAELGGAAVAAEGGLLCVFGAPRSVEDHLHRALLAAIRLRDLAAPGSGGAGPGIGVASGSLPADPEAWLSDPTQAGPIGAALSLARVAASGDVVIDSRTVAVLPDGAAAEPLADQAATDPGHRLHRVLGVGRRYRLARSRRGAPLSPLIGRERQLLAVQEALALADGGTGQVIGFVGEPGMGKSRLVDEVRRASRDRVRWLEGRCVPYGATQPYLPLLEVLRELCGVAHEDAGSVESAVERTFVRFGVPAGRLPFVLNVLDALDQEQAAGIAVLSPEAVRERTFEALRHLLLVVARDRLLVVTIEDIHWADATTMRFLDSLASAIAGARLVLFTTSRPGSGPDSLGAPHATQIELPRLGPADALQIVRAVLGLDDVPEEVGRTILARGDGNPFFLEELALAAPAGDPSKDVPLTVQDVLMARIDRLEDAPRSVLQTASVLGRRFPVHLLAAVWPAQDPVHGHLEHLVRGGFLVETVVEGQPGYEFKHALTHDVAYQGLSAGDRAALHEAAGLWLEGLYAGRTEEVDGLLAHHWSQTVDAARAVAYLQRAAEKSFRGYAHAEASTMLREAIRHAARFPGPSGEDRVVDLTLRLVSSIYFLGRMEESEGILAGLAPRIDLVRDRSLLCAFQFWTAHTASHLGEPELADAAGRASIELAEHLGDDAALGRALYIRVRQGWWTGRFAEGVEEGTRAVPLLENAGETWWLGHCHFFMAHSLYQTGQFDRALEAAHRGGMIGDAVADPRLRSWAAWARGLYEAARGETEAGIAHCERGLELSPDEPNTAWALGALGFAHREHGDEDLAVDHLERALSIAEGTRHPGILARFTGWLGEARRRAGDLGHAADAAVRSGAIGRETGCHWVVALSLRTRGRIELDRRDVARARVLLGEARAALQMLGCEFDLALCHMDLARLAHREGRDPGPAIDAARHLLDRLPAPIYRERLRDLADDLGVREQEADGTGRLTTREREVLRHLATGLTNREIAAALVISEGTAIRHVSNIFGKLGVNNRSAATRRAIQHGFLADHE